MTGRKNLVTLLGSIFLFAAVGVGIIYVNPDY
jgi:hypothetical protein